MIKKISNNEVELKFYGEIGRWEWNSKNFSRYFNELDSKYKKINIRLHCHGGDVMEGNVIYNTIINANAETTIIIDGVAASMGSIIMLAADKIKMAENALIMIHNPSGGTYGNAAAHLSNAKLLRAMERNFAKKYAAKTGQSEKDCSKYFDGTDHWMDSEEALSLGLVDEIVEPVSKNIKKLNTSQAKTMSIEAVCNSFCALTDKIETNYKSEMNKQKLIERFGLKNVTADSSETAIEEALNTKYEALNNAKIQAETKFKEAQKTRIKDVIEAKASLVGVEMSDEQKQAYQKMGEAAGMDVLNTALSALSPRTAISSLVNKGDVNNSNNRKDWDWKKWNKEDPEGLEKMESKDSAAFNALYKAEFGELPE